MSDTQEHSMSIFETALAAAGMAKPMIETPDGRRLIVRPREFDVQDVSDPHRLPPRIKQKITFIDRSSLTTYAKRFQDHRSILLANYEAGTIAAHLDWHASSDHDLEPQACDHVATLKIDDSEEFTRWNKMEGKLHSQEEFAYFVEENVSDVIDPEASDLVEICRELEATQGTAFKSGTRLENGDRTFIYETETRVKSEVSVPTEITLRIPLYHGEEPSEVRAKFRFRPSTNGLMLGFQWHRVEYARQATFRQMAHQVSEDTGLMPLFGAL